MRNDSQIELAIIILNWNAADDTIRCLRHIASWKNLRPAVWVVDNASSDDSVEIISSACPNVHLVRNATNLGFAGGNNRGILEALSLGDVPILLLNNDAFIEEEDATRLLDTLQEHEQIGFVGPLLFAASRPDKLLAAGGRNPVLHHHTHILELTTGEPVRIVECVPGTVLVVRAEVIRTVGLLDEDYFFNMEVADLCIQARQAGYVSVIDTRARAFHDTSRSSAFRETLYAYYIIRNRFLLTRKFYGGSKFLLYAFWTLYSLALIVKLQLEEKPAAARAVCLGLFDGLSGRFGRQNERVLSYCTGSARFLDFPRL